MDKGQIILIAILEAVGVILIVRLWVRRRMPVLRRIVWSVILLLPLLGPLFFGFTQLNPSEHGDEPPDKAGDTL